ncbi:UDP-2,3-diacylglucosamine diphosphatase [Larkinella soli]|uniref:UDP-2,3-diacylglucosamine diphosphatase n=1 Tax=Larkinella soli TaxID=1770527 RepID=UPI000FFBA4B7|nr:UDP-2,3-diacylglucosamine diphosphatase [Larkinella soli]
MFPIEHLSLPPDRAVYFASDFHLGTPTPEISRDRERRIVRWLDSIEADAGTIFLVGDVFDFWFEYRKSIPKGFIRLQGKLAQLTDAGIPIVLFSGNHDMWMSSYFTDEMGIPVHRNPRSYQIAGKLFHIGHGDGLGPGDQTYKRLKKLFENPLAQTMFRWLHPDIGIGIADRWSRHSRASHQGKFEEFMGEDNEWIMQYCREVEARQHHDFYIFGHRHLPLDLSVGKTSRYINLGEWLNYNTYARFDRNTVTLSTFES